MKSSTKQKLSLGGTPWQVSPFNLQLHGEPWNHHRGGLEGSPPNKMWTVG